MGAVKLLLLLDHDGYLPTFATVTEGDVHEVNVAWDRRALESGIYQEALVQTVNVASAVNAGVTTAIAVQGIEKEELHLACPDGTCTA